MTWSIEKALAAGTSRITFWSVRIAQYTIDYRTDLDKNSTRERKKFSPIASGPAHKIGVKKAVNMWGRSEDLQVRIFDAVSRDQPSSFFFCGESYSHPFIVAACLSDG